jgi:hypothetical protein
MKTVCQCLICNHGYATENPSCVCLQCRVEAKRDGREVTRRGLVEKNYKPLAVEKIMHAIFGECREVVE